MNNDSPHSNAELKLESMTDNPASAAYAGAFFPGSQNFVINSSSFTSVTNYNTTVDAEYKRMIEWLSPLNFFQRQADIFSNWQPGTGNWLLACPQFKHWENSAGSVLWCPGIPGAGKTVLASLAVNHLTARAYQENFGLACLFINHKETDSQTPQNLLGALLRQLLLGKSTPDAVRTIHGHDRAKETKPTVDDLCTMLNSAIVQYCKVHLVIDALDEYPEDSRNLLLQALTRLGPTSNLMITSRPNISVKSFFPDLQTLEIFATEEDISRYITQQIASSSLSKRIEGRPELHEEIQAKISSNAKGMFLLAKLHIDSLKTKLNVKAVRKALQDLPKGLQATYDEAMARINHQSEDASQLAYQVLTWVAKTKRLLTVAELQEALAIEPEDATIDADNLTDINTIVSVCSGLITVDETASVVRLIHYTTQDYLNSLTVFSHADVDIVSSCMTYLSFKDFEALPDSGDQKKGLLMQHPFLSYAQYCLLHVYGQPEQKLQDLIVAFLERAQDWNDFWGEECLPWEHSTMYGPSTMSALCISASLNLQTITKILLTQGSISETAMDSALIAAAFGGYLEIVHLLLEKGAKMNLVEEAAHGTALQAACCRNHEKVVQLLLEKGADMNIKGGSDGTALQAAAKNGHRAVVELLIKNGVDINMQHGKYVAPKQVALSMSKLPPPDMSEGFPSFFLRTILSYGAHFSEQGGLYGTALNAASGEGHDTVVQLLVENGADLTIQRGMYGSALQAASYSGHKTISKFLIQNGADVNMCCGYYGTALEAASAEGHEEVIQLLLEKGADLNMEGGEYGTALGAASKFGHLVVVQLLLEKGANLNSQAGDDGTALQAASTSNNQDVVHLLLENGADVDMLGGKHGTALQGASRKGLEAIVQMLLAKGADINMQGGKYGTALQAASTKGHEEVVQLLIGNGADINILGGKYGTALQAASYKGLEATVQLLLAKGADINMKGGKYGTALQAASAEGHEAVVQWLIEKGADVHVLGGKYGTAVQAASENGHEAIVQLLIQNGADPNIQAGDHESAPPECPVS